MEQFVVHLLSQLPLGRILNAAGGVGGGGGGGGVAGGVGGHSTVDEEQKARVINRYLYDFVSMVYKPLSCNPDEEKHVWTAVSHFNKSVIYFSVRKTLYAYFKRI